MVASEYLSGIGSDESDVSAPDGNEAGDMIDLDRPSDIRRALPDCPAPVVADAPVGSLTRSASDVRDRVNLIQYVMRDVMKRETHYGVIPGCGTKPVLLKPGAEVLCVTFRLAPDFVVERIEPAPGHREYQVECRITHQETGRFLGAGAGSCSSMESKYRYRGGGRRCPKCSMAGTIIKGKAEYGGGWLCFGKKGGCGAKFLDQDATITGQSEERVENPDVADAFNTVLKMATKRALVAAALIVTGASDIFTQDIEEQSGFGGNSNPAPAPSPEPQSRRVQELLAEIAKMPGLAELVGCGATMAGMGMTPPEVAAVAPVYAARRLRLGLELIESATSLDGLDGCKTELDGIRWGKDAPTIEEKFGSVKKVLEDLVPF